MKIKINWHFITMIVFTLIYWVLIWLTFRDYSKIDIALSIVFWVIGILISVIFSNRKSNIEKEIWGDSIWNDSKKEFRWITDYIRINNSDDRYCKMLRLAIFQNTIAYSRIGKDFVILSKPNLRIKYCPFCKKEFFKDYNTIAHSMRILFNEVNPACWMCDHYINGNQRYEHSYDCGGDWNNSFYYPNDCGSFHSTPMQEQQEAYEQQQEEEFYNQLEEYNEANADQMLESYNEEQEDINPNLEDD